MENLTLESLDDAIELGKELHRSFEGLDLQTAVSRAIEIIEFDRKIEELGERYIGKGGLLNKRIKISGEFGDKSEKLFINGTVKMFSMIGSKGKDKPFYQSIVCIDNWIYSKGCLGIIIPDEKEFCPYSIYTDEKGNKYQFRIKNIEVIE